MRVLKYQLRVGRDTMGNIDKLVEQDILLPAGSKILCIDGRRDELFLWALVKPDEPVETRKLITVSTGTEIPEQGLGHIKIDYITTVVIDRWFVGNIFEVKVKPNGLD